MPLRQSRLNFSHRLSTTIATVAPTGASSVKDNIVGSLAGTGADADTIVVDITESNTQLPTPSESATDVSSQGTAADSREILSIPRTSSSEPSHGTHTSANASNMNIRKSRFREESVDGPEATGDDKNRGISGETLVSKTSQSSLLKNGIKALDLEWSIGDALAKNLQKDGAKTTPEEESEVESTLVVKPDNIEDDAERAARLAALKAKREQNAKKWEQRRKAAEKNATRRSGRASLVLEKAGDVISGIASGVLGKRARDANDNDPKSSTRAQDGSGQDQGSAAKRLRLSEQEKPLPSLPKKTPVRGEKRWLISGLYAGQARSFDARLTESGNKKKTNPTNEANKSTKENAVLPLPMFAGERLLKQGRDFKLPFDIFSPVPAGQAKPEGWRKQNRNIVVGDAVDFWRLHRVHESSKCICRKETGCDHNCLNRTMYYECDNSNCNVPQSVCENRQWNDLAKRVKLSLPYSIGVDVVKTVDRGHGVRANRTFEPGQIILEYTGEIITQEECERRMRTDYKTNECYYLMLFDQNMILDATRGSMARFVNHSCEPNCRMEKWTVGGHPRMALFAGDRGIMTGEELTYDYNFDPYSQKNVQECRCGAKTCRGFLGPKPKDVKQKSPETDGAGKKPEGRIAGAKRKVAEVLSESTNRLNKKRKTETTKSPKAAAKGKALVAVKKVTKKKVTIAKTTMKAGKQRDIAVKKIIADTKKKTTLTKGKRIISTGSMRETLISKGSPKKSSKPFGRSSSLKAKAVTLKKSVVASVRGRGK